ncbi:MAG TPA: 7TM diverse intracellular signaling domain-containing protein [Ramlibacter sp.]|nr:7TM diverse intracellular signaling domain-containing protein [Ramlibacter sp.]
MTDRQATIAQTGPTGPWLWAACLMLLLAGLAHPAWAQKAVPEGRVLVDPVAALTPAQAWARLEAGEGLAYAPRQFQPTGARNAVWFLLRLPPAGDPSQARVLTLQYPGLDAADLFLAPDDAVPSARAGDSLPVAQWTLPHLHPVLPLSAQVSTVLVRARNSHPVSFPWVVESVRDFERERQWMLLLLGSYLGLVGLVLVLSAVNAVSLRDSAHVAYAVYVLALAITQASLTGLGGLFVWSDNAYWNDLAPLMLAMFSAALLAVLVRAVVQPLPRPWLEGLLWAYMACGLALAGLFATVGRQPASFALANYYFILSFPLCLGLLLWYAARRSAAGWWLAAGVLALLAGSLLQALRNLGVMPLSIGTQYGSQIGAAVEIPLLLIGLYRRSRERRDAMVREAALQRRDPLTGVLNERVAADRFTYVLQRLRRQPGTACLVRMRVANIAAIRRDHGAQVADVAMVHAASCIGKVTNEGDTVGRLANGDFLLIVEEQLLAADAGHRLARMLAFGLMPSPRMPGGQVLDFHAAYTLEGHAWLDAAALLADLGAQLHAIAQSPQRLIRPLKTPGQRTRMPGVAPALGSST